MQSKQKPLCDSTVYEAWAETHLQDPLRSHQFPAFFNFTEISLYPLGFVFRYDFSATD